MSDQRKVVRKKLMAFTPVYDANQKTLLGYVMNLSLLGLKVVGEKVMETDVDMLLKIEFPTDLPDIASRPVTILAHSIWCNQDKYIGNFNTGFEFNEVTPEQTKIFEAILARYQFHQDMPR